MSSRPVQELVRRDVLEIRLRESNPRCHRPVFELGVCDALRCATRAEPVMRQC